MINTVTLMGRLTAEPELKTTTTGKSVTSFTVAVDDNYRDSNGNYKTNFIRCVAWGKTAEFICEWFGKGQMIAINGSIQVRKYEDNHGNNREAVEVLAQNVSFCGDSRKAEGQSAHKNTKSDINIKADDDTWFTPDEELPF